MSLIQNLLLGNIGDLFNALQGGVFPSDADSDGTANIRIDWRETPEAHVFDADLPGVRKEDVKVEVEDGRVLSITGRRSGEEKEATGNWHCAERNRGGRFFRRFTLPDDAKAEEMKASVADGVLTLVVPKGEVDKPEVRSVEIAGGGGGKKKGKGGKGKMDDDGGATCCNFWPL